MLLRTLGALTEPRSPELSLHWRKLARYNQIMDLDDKVCLCFRITRRKLVNFVRIHKPKVASQLSECGGAGTGCGWCVPFLKQIFKQSAEGKSTELEVLTPEEYERRRAEYVRSGKGTPPPGATPLPEE